LLPALFERHAVNNNKHGEDEIQLPLNRLLAAPKSVEVETPESAHATNAENAEDTEANQPSLQTQAFFAEIIAAEPEIDEFEEQNGIQSDEADSTTKSSETPVEAPASVEPSAVAPNEAVAGEIPAMTSTPVAPVLPTRNEKNGDINLLQPSVETVDKSTTSSAVIEISTSRHELESFLVTNNGKDSLLPKSSEPATTSRGAAVIPGRRDSQSQPGEDPVPAGQQVLGRYLIEREIGKGAMGKIYLAFDPKLDRRVVIKTVCFNRASCDTEVSTLKDRVYREARAIAKLSHPNIVVVYDVEDDKEMSYIVMEHIEGRDLRQTLKSERRLDYQRAITIVTQVCSALDYAHQAGIVHRDIKPSNIMLLPNDKAKVTDFGIAKIADNFSLTLPGHVLGTPSYMAPEQFDGETLDGRADLFSLGVVFYELLTGTRPFVGDSVASLAYRIVHKMHIPPSLQNVELPLELDEITGRALAKQPEARYQTAKEFREALLAIKFEMAV
jgi:tRNA A-37 threonylcarbamoyl transferase component Bud32